MTRFNFSLFLGFVCLSAKFSCPAYAYDGSISYTAGTYSTTSLVPISASVSLSFPQWNASAHPNEQMQYTELDAQISYSANVTVHWEQTPYNNTSTTFVPEYLFGPSDPPLNSSSGPGSITATSTDPSVAGSLSTNLTQQPPLYFDAVVPPGPFGPGNTYPAGVDSVGPGTATYTQPYFFQVDQSLSGGDAYNTETYNSDALTINFVQTDYFNYVPEPTSIGLLCLPMFLGMTRRHRSIAL
jgi:hypothetical protein